MVKHTVLLVVLLASSLCEAKTAAPYEPDEPGVASIQGGDAIVQVDAVCKKKKK